MTPILKNIIIVMVMGVVIYIGYQMFIAGNLGSLDMTNAGAEAQDALVAKSQEFIQRREMLTSVILDVNFLTDRKFTSLRSFSTPVPEQSVGRASIFDKPLPVGTTVVTDTL